MTPALRPNLSLNLNLKPLGENKLLGSARESYNTQNKPQNENADDNTFAPPQESKEIYINKNAETQFDNYINASYCNSSEQLKLFIAAQAPKSNTVADFLQMIFENNVTLCLMVSSWSDNGKEKCTRYIGKKLDEGTEEGRETGQGH